MTPEGIKTCCKALAMLMFIVGGFGSIACVPYAMSYNLNVVAVIGTYFCAGAIMMAGGLGTFVYLTTQK